MFELLIFPTLFAVSCGVSLAIILTMLLRWRQLRVGEHSTLYAVTATIAAGLPPGQIGFSTNEWDAGLLLTMQLVALLVLVVASRKVRA